jgi:phenylpyruvate tautomerase PptA (4-oxalocrotonate tautomerase family)
MPFVRIDIQSGKSTAYKRAILASTRRAISSALGVGGERVLQRITESPVDDIDVLERSDRFTLVEIAMKERDNERKQRLYAAVVNELGESPGIVAHDVAVYLVEQPGECFCTSGADIAGSDRADAVPSGAGPPGRSGASGGDAADG